MKLAIGGKGGVGKTTVAASLAKAFADRGFKVLAIDADPNATLASAFGLKDAGNIVPIVKMDELIEERTGAKPGTSGGMFNLNPHVADIPDRFCRDVAPGIRMMVMGALKIGGGGCFCPENAMLKALITHLLLGREEVVILDMEAGIEHLSRGTAESVDRLLVVVEPGRRSIETAHTVKKLASDIGVKRIGIVGNKVRSKKDEDYLREMLSDFDIFGFLPYLESVIEADMELKPPYELSPELLTIMGDMIDRLGS